MQACWSLVNDAMTFQKRCTVRSRPVNPPAYLVLARMSSTSTPPSTGPLIRTCSSGSLNNLNQGLSITSQSPLVKACDCSFRRSQTRYFATNPAKHGLAQQINKVSREKTQRRTDISLFVGICDLNVAAVGDERNLPVPAEIIIRDGKC